MLGKHSLFYVLLIVSLTSLVVIQSNLGGVGVYYVPDAQKDDGGSENVSELEIMPRDMRALDLLVHRLLNSLSPF
jgi:hypothetical protein